MNEGGGLKRLAGFLLSQLGSGELAELVIDEREKLLGGARITVVDCGEKTSYLTHAVAS